MKTKQRVIIVLLSTVVLLATPIGAAAASVSVGHSGWTWGDPTPQGESLNGVTFLGERGFAVGDVGTLLRSDDGGLTWIGLSSGTRDNLSLVQAVEANTVIVGGGCTVRESFDSGESFQRLPLDESEGTCGSDVASFSFLSGRMGYVEQADGSILLTTDGGKTLQAKTSVPLNGATASKLDFISPSVGFAITRDTASGRIFHTIDGGNSWTQVGASPAPLSDITFVTPSTAYAVGANSTFLQSTDGGTTWAPRSLTLPGRTPRPSLTHISCSNPMNCLIATELPSGTMTNMLLRTTDGGMTAEPVASLQQNLLAVAFSTSSSAAAVGESGATVLSADGGATFSTPISSNLGRGGGGTTLRLGQSPLDAYVPWPMGRIAATTSGGATWSILRVPTSADLRDVAFPTVQTGYALSKNGTVFRTANAGVNWSMLSAKGAKADALLAPNPSTVLLIGPRGVRRSKDGGEHFKAVDGMVVTGGRRGKPIKARLSNINLSQGAEIAPGAIFARGNGVFESTDAGASWALIPRPLRRGHVSAMSFVNATTGYEVSGEHLFFTRDRGRVWREIQSVDVDHVLSDSMLSFTNKSDGYLIGDLAGYTNVLMRTEDAGRTWAPEILGFPLVAVAAGGPVDYAAGGRGLSFFASPFYGTSEPITSLFQTTDGGRSPSPSALTLSVSGPRRLTRAQLKRAGYRVRLVGRLSPALADEVVTVKWSTAGEHGRVRWMHFENVVVTSAGTFAVTASGVTATTDFVAQWTGDDVHSGAGTAAVQLTVSRGRAHSRTGRRD